MSKKYIDKAEFTGALELLKKFVNDNSKGKKKKEMAKIQKALDIIEDRSENLVYQEEIYNKLLGDYHSHWCSLRYLEDALKLNLVMKAEMNVEAGALNWTYHIESENGNLIAELPKERFVCLAETNFIPVKK